jgi:hypothetical protein
MFGDRLPALAWTIDGVMRAGGRRLLSLVAIYVIALHTILWGVTPLFAAQPIDPFSDICHSNAPLASPTEQSPVGPASAPTHACDHCNLCSIATPLAALDSALASHLLPARLLQILRPTSAAGRGYPAITLYLARGPPAFA